jgi:hypothetical protein
VPTAPPLAPSVFVEPSVAVLPPAEPSVCGGKAWELPQPAAPVSAKAKIIIAVRFMGRSSFRLGFSPGAARVVANVTRAS